LSGEDAGQGGGGAPKALDGRIAANAMIVMGATVISRVTGYFRELLIPARFGAGAVADAYYAAFKLPDFMFNLLIGGAISAALVPILSGSISKGEEKEGWAAVSRFINAVMAAAAVISVLGAVFAPQLVTILLPGYSPDVPEQLEILRLTARLTRVLFPSVAFLMLAGFANSVLYSYQRFTAAAFGPALYNVLCVLSILALSGGDEASYYNVDRVVYGIMASALAYFLFQASFAMKNIRGNYVPTLNLRHRGFVRLVLIAVPALVASSVLHVNILVATYFASLYGEGTLARFNLADRTWQLPFGIIASSVGIALLPVLSGKMAKGDVGGFNEDLTRGLRSALFLIIPTAAGLASLSGLVVRAMWQNSAKVSEAALDQTAAMLACFCVALCAQSANTILNRAFYACNRTLTPMLCGVCVIGLNIALNFAFYGLHRAGALEAVGAAAMPLAYSAACCANTVLLATLLGRRVQGLSVFGGSGGFFARVGASAAAMSAALLAAWARLPKGWVVGEFSAGLRARQVAAFGALAALGAAVYFAAALLLKTPEALFVTGAAKGRALKLLRKAGLGRQRKKVG